MEIFKRPLEQNEITCWKALITIHSLLYEGHPRVIEDACFRISYFQSLLSSSNKFNSRRMGELIHGYLTFLLDKLHLHQRYPFLSPDLNAEKIKKKELTSEISLQLVNFLLDLQQSILNFQRKIFQKKELVDCIASSLIPLILESYNIYTFQVYLLNQLVQEVDSMDVLSFLIERFYAQYINIRTFFHDSSNIKYVTSIIAVPMLPQEPPIFTPPEKKRITKLKKKPSSTEMKTNMNNTENLISTNSNISNPIFQEQNSVINNPIPNNPFAPVINGQHNWVTFDNSYPQQPSFHEFSLPFQLPIQQQSSLSAQQLPVQNKPASDFSDLVNMFHKKLSPISSEELKKQEEIAKKELEEKRKKELEEKRKKDLEEKRKKDLEEKRKKDLEEKRKKDLEEKRKKEEEERKKREQQRILEEQEKIKKIVQEESNKEIQQLKLRIVELENLLEKEKDKNRQLSLENKELIEKIQEIQNNFQNEKQEKVNMLQKLEESQATINFLKENQLKIQQDNLHLKQKFESLIAQQEEENQRLLLKDITTAFNSLNSLLSKLDNPTNFGNESANINNIIDDTNLVDSVTVKLVEICDHGSREQLVEVLSEITASSSQLFDDVKGFSRKIDNQEIRQQLLDSGRNIGFSLSKLLSLVKNMGGQVQEENDKILLSNSLGDVQQKLKLLSNIVQNSTETNETNKENIGEDLDTLAEKELLAAAAAIEQAAKTLLDAKSRQQQANENSKPPEVANAILDAAMAITKATSMLVIAAAAAQKERIEKGKVTSNIQVYKRDPTWSQGLISAAKAVANTTSSLIETANQVVLGFREEETVIAASKAVAASTAQLIAATRAKAEDLNSDAQLKLNAASKAVTHATSQLVAAAKSALPINNINNNQQPLSQQGIQKQIKEMELQTQILKLEKELDQARKQLFGFRKQEYTNNNNNS